MHKDLNINIKKNAYQSEIKSQKSPLKSLGDSLGGSLSQIA
jgi:hypothetical protein